MDDKERSNLAKEGKKTHPIERHNIVSNLFFCWALPFFAKSFRKNLTQDDLFEPLKVHESRRLGDKMEDAWSIEIKNKRNPSLWRAINRVFGKEFAMYGVVFIVTEGIKTVQPIFIGQLLAYYAPGQTKISKNSAYIYAVCLVLSILGTVLMVHSYVFALMHLGMKVKVGCCSLVYRKSLRLSKTAMAETTVGQMVNLLSNDVNRFDFAFVHLHNLWLAPVETIIIAYILFTIVGPTALAGIGILLLFIPFQLYLGKRSAVYRMRTALKTDQRVRLMNEIISGIQVIKMYTWEKPFAKLVEKARKLEIHQIKYASYLRALNFSFVLFLNRTAIFFCVITYVLTGNTLNAQYVYIVTSFYGNLRQALTMFLPQGVTAFAESNVSVRRIETFLQYDEIVERNENQTKSNGLNSISLVNKDPSPTEDVGIYMDKVSVKWIKTSSEYTLSQIDFRAENHQLIAVVGTVGSGKSTLLHVILRELVPINGDFKVTGTISYASQEPWLFAGSVRQNILFGQEMNLKRYQEVVKVCALQRDFSLFPYGDRTMVGEKGVTLSGGQKARINLARAIYKKADIYLLDDPLSAVDTNVGKQLFDSCIAGFLKDKCTVLVTHQLQYLRTVDQIYLLANGLVKASGTYSELQEKGGKYLELLQEDPNKEDENIDDVITAKKSKSSLSLQQNGDLPIEEKEQQSIGKISSSVYKHYARAGGNWFICSLLLSLFVISQIAASGSDYFLSFWVNLEQKRTEEAATQNQTITKSTESPMETFLTSDNCMYLFTGLIISIIVMTLTRSMSFFKFCMNASTNLHNIMFGKVVCASMRFFNTNPSGRILNRFSKDMGSIDEYLPNTVIDTVQIGLTAFAITIVVCVVNPWILIPTVILLGLFYMYRVVFLSSSRDIKRIEGITRSPVFSHITASLQGLTTIRAFGAQNILMDEFDNHQDLHSSAFYLFMGCSRAFGFWLDFNCVVYIALITFSFLLLDTEVYGGNVGLAITQAVALTGMLQWGIRQWSEMENQMTSVERVVEYTDLPSELSDDSKIPPSDWPKEGTVDFDGVSMQYARDEPFVLKKLSFSIKDCEKVGIVGRTGAGKSSLISALFRLVNIEGRIIIDKVNISEISLHSLRSKISIIPQEPVLFSGSLRKNLDPFDEFSDEQIWSALEEVELKAPISDLASGLQSLVSEGGSNFSVGQRQLLCLARAVIRSNKILVMDEATANVDPQTDELIQRTIRRKFKNCTVLTIAHRLHTVMDSDKVLVMDAGRAVEFGHPHELLQNHKGIFYGLVQQTGRGMAGNLREIAKDNHKNNKVP